MFGVHSILKKRETHGSDKEIKKLIENKFVENLKKDKPVTKIINPDAIILKAAHCGDSVVTLDEKNNLTLWDVVTTKKVWQLTIQDKEENIPINEDKVHAGDEMDIDPDTPEKFKYACDELILFDNRMVLYISSPDPRYSWATHIKIIVKGKLTGEIQTTEKYYISKKSYRGINNHIFAVIHSYGSDTAYDTLFFVMWDSNGKMLNSTRLALLAHAYPEELSFDTSPHHYVIACVVENYLAVILFDLQTLQHKTSKLLENEYKDYETQVNGLRYFNDQLIIAFHYIRKIPKYGPKMTCKPQISVFDLLTGKLLHNYKLTGLLGTIKDMVINDDYIVFCLDHDFLAMDIIYSIDRRSGNMASIKEIVNWSGNTSVNLYLTKSLLILRCSIDATETRWVIDLNLREKINETTHHHQSLKFLSYSDFVFFKIINDGLESTPNHIYLEDFREESSAHMLK